jgi:hypothetical protein
VKRQQHRDRISRKASLSTTFLPKVRLAAASATIPCCFRAWTASYSQLAVPAHIMADILRMGSAAIRPYAARSIMPVST